MARLPAALRRRVIERAGLRCEYCQAPLDILVDMEIDHITPEAAGGESTPDNLALACVGCNGHKLAFQTGIDPESGCEEPLYHPRRQRWAEHFAWEADGAHVLGLTPSGRATVERLRMNRPAIVEARRLWRAAGWKP